MPPTCKDPALQPYTLRDDSLHCGIKLLCHECARAPKLTTTSLEPTTPVDGLKWYFDAPWEKGDEAKCPARWCTPNRDTSLDPELLDIAEIDKHGQLENDARHVRPPAWESAFTVHAVLGGPSASKAKVPINLFSFLMNKAWSAHPTIKYLRDDWLLRPQRADYCGFVLNLPEIRLMPPFPPSPWGGGPTVEELPEGDEAAGLLENEMEDGCRRPSEEEESDSSAEADEERRAALAKRARLAAERKDDPYDYCMRRSPAGLFGRAMHLQRVSELETVEGWKTFAYSFH